VITHVVMFRWTADAPPDQSERVAAALLTLPGTVPTIRAYRCGANLVPGTNFDFAVVGEFDDLAGHAAYVAHDSHEAIASTMIRPFVAERASVQFENPGSTGTSNAS
jgi:hypothetical protein